MPHVFMEVGSWSVIGGNENPWGETWGENVSAMKTCSYYYVCIKDYM